MPSRNVLKYDAPDAYYHVYARGNCRQAIYLDDEDRDYFLSLFARYLSVEFTRDRNGIPYPHLYGKVELLAYCLMDNHFHLLFFQQEQRAMKTLMQCLLTSYSRYFNKKYKRSGSLFESRYKASMILDDEYLQHISRYIHLNPKQWERFPYSSLRYYFTQERPVWMQPERIETLFESRASYLQFIRDYEERKKEVDETKYSLRIAIRTYFC